MVDCPAPFGETSLADLRARLNSRVVGRRFADVPQLVQDLPEAFDTEELSETEVAALPDEEAIERLIGIKGVGRWTAEIALLRGLGRADVFPGGDLGVVKYLATGLLGHSARVKEGAMREFAERWRPYRGLALMYAYAEINRRAAEKR